jgi:uncharacterized membrane protein
MKQWSDQSIEYMIGNLLRAGVLLAGTVVAAGGCVYLLRHGLEAPHYRVFHGEPTDLVSIPAILRYALSGRGRGIIQTGLLLLIATPIVRVALSIVGFAKERDWMYVTFTMIVFGVLCYSLFGS